MGKTWGKGGKAWGVLVALGGGQGLAGRAACRPGRAGTVKQWAKSAGKGRGRG